MKTINNHKLPLQKSKKEALKIYKNRLKLFLITILINLAVLALILLSFQPSLTIKIYTFTIFIFLFLVFVLKPGTPQKISTILAFCFTIAASTQNSFYYLIEPDNLSTSDSSINQTMSDYFNENSYNINMSSRIIDSSPRLDINQNILLDLPEISHWKDDKENTYQINIINNKNNNIYIVEIIMENMNSDLKNVLLNGRIIYLNTQKSKDKMDIIFIDNINESLNMITFFQKMQKATIILNDTSQTTIRLYRILSEKER